MCEMTKAMEMVEEKKNISPDRICPKKISLNGNDWQMKEFIGMDWVWRDSVMPGTSDVRWWYPASVPGSVIHDLMQNGLVPDPYFECNSRLVEWASARTWVYRKLFRIPVELKGKKIALCLDGVDHQSEIFLNGVSLGRQEGMFIPWEAFVEDKLLYGEDNLLAVVIEPAPVDQPQVGKTSLVYTHKSRMTYWWDFCPRMIHQGIWQDVWLKVTGEAILGDVRLQSRLRADGSAQVSVDVSVEGDCDGSIQVSFGEYRQEAFLRDGAANCLFEIKNPRLWWCNGQGDAYEYPVEISLFDRQGGLSDFSCREFGLREIRFEKNEGSKGEKGAFWLHLNGRPVFINGYNWVPADVLYGAVTQERVAHLIKLAKDAGVNLFRVWGGGLIERDSFYRMCAKEGILVWQDFILSSSGIENTPSSKPEYAKMLAAQAEIIIKRKRNHTALAVWCGGNELQDGQGMPLDEKHPLIKTLADVVKKWDPERKWLPTTPSGGVFMNSMENIQNYPDKLYDVHGPWEHQGLKEHYALYNAGTCMLHSEFGVEGMTNEGTLFKSVSPDHLLPASKDNEIYFHRGAWWNNEPLVQESFAGTLKEIGQIRRASQYLQYEGLKYAMECDRRRAFACSGILPWQFNEPYPNLFCTSAVDYYGNPKPAYWGARKVYQPWLVNAAFSGPALAGEYLLAADIYAGRNLQTLEAETQRGYQVVVGLYGMQGQELAVQVLMADKLDVKIFGVGRIEFALPKVEEGLYLLRLCLKSEAGAILAGNEYLFTAGNDFAGMFALPKAQIVAKASKGGITLKNVGNVAALYLFFEKEEGSPIYWEENYISLLPGEEKQIAVAGEIKGSSLTAFNMDRLEVVYESNSGD